MKKTVLAAALAVGSLPAFANPDIRLYGVIDEGINYTNNVGGHSSVEMQSGYVQGSRWGLMGAEDLGGGLKTLFQLENGFNASNGKLAQGGLLFGRQAYFGLEDDKFGRLTLGRQYDAVVEWFAQTTIAGNWGGLIFGHPYDNDNTLNTFRVNNTIKYTSPTLSGLRFGGTYSFSNDTQAKNNRQYSAGFQYATGGLLFAAGYLQADNPSATANGAINNSGDQNFLAKRLRIYGAGVNYTAGNATAGLAYSGSDIAQPLSSGYVGPITPPPGTTFDTLRFDNFELNAKYQFTPAFFMGAAYTYTRATVDATGGKLHPVYHSVGVMADYTFSKRTDVYFQGGYQHVGGDKTGSVLDSGFNTGSSGVSSTSNQFILRAAIRHKF